MPLATPPRSESHRQSDENSSPPSPTDSGYGSATPSLSPPRGPLNENGLPLADYDGSQSDSDDPFVASDTKNTLRADGPALFTTPTTHQTPLGFQRELAALPKRSSYSRPVLPPSFYPGLSTKPQQRTPSTSSLRYHDRFLPVRPQEGDLSEKFRTNKAPHELTPTERLLRHSGASEDAFCYHRRIVTPLGSEFRQQSRSESAASRSRGPLYTPVALFNHV